MIDKLDAAFSFSEQALALRAQRQQLLASNIANANTPNFRARDIDFTAALKAATGAAQAKGTVASTLTQTSAGHLAGSASAAGGAATPQYRVPTQPSIDGNTVEMDVERAQFADNAVRYEANLNVISAQIKTMLAALQG